MAKTLDEATEQQRRGGTFQPLRHRAFLLLWLGQFTSQVGDWIAFVALTGLVWNLTHADLWVAALRATHAGPILLLGPVAGVFVDRWNRRATMLTVDLARTVLMSALAASGAVAALLRLPELATILGLSLVFELVSLVFSPAKNALIPHLVPPEDLLAANALSGMTGTVSLLLGPALGGLAVALAGVGGALGVDAATFAVSAATIAALRAPRVVATAASTGGQLRRVLGELREGLRYVRGERVVLVTTALEAALMLGWGTISILAVVIAERQLGLDVRGYGFLLAAFGAGSLVGWLLVAPLERRGDPRVTLAVGFLCGAAGIFALVAARTLPVALLGYAGAGVGQMIVSVVGLTLFQQEVREAMRGRAFAIYNTAGHGMILLANQGAASIADLVALGPTLLVAGLAQLGGAAVAATLLPRGASSFHRMTNDE
ncbi:MAG TPA: MFS transporter [Thermomicrobiales bacterium]|nr:MFS transporter [Thermomicrobiales bacterium]